jgi:hypothetical protein
VIVSTQGCVQPRDWTFNPASASRVEISTLGLTSALGWKFCHVIISINPRLKLFMSYSSMRGSDYLLQENKMKAFFYFRELMPRTYSIAFQPRVEIVHVIAKKFQPG